MSVISNLSRKPALWLGLACSLAAGLKAWLVTSGRVMFNADEAVVALMGRHILQGERPVFFYGQAYMGSLDAWLMAAGFALFGERVWVIRALQALLYLFFLVTVFWLGEAVFGGWQAGALGALLLAVPTVNVSLYTTASLGGYGEALVLGNLILLCGLRIWRGWDKGGFPGSPVWWGLLGLLSGLGLWAFGLTLVYSLPLGLWLAWEGWQRRGQWTAGQGRRLAGALAALGAGFLIGALPWWGYALRNGLAALVGELGGGAIAGVEGLGFLGQVGRHAANLLLLGITVTLGMRPPWSAGWLALPLLPFALAAWCAALAAAWKGLRGVANPRPAQLLVGVIAALVAAFILTPFGADPSGRYFLPLAAPLALFAAWGILELRTRLGAWALGIAGLLMAYQLWGTLQAAFDFPPGISTQFYEPSQIDHRYDEALMSFLERNGETRGYSNYWVAYPLAFLSGERLIFAPRLPYHLDLRYTERDDRLPAYTRLVEESPRAAFITTRNPELDQALRGGFAGLGVSWQEARIGDYQVFYALSQPVRPEQVGLGKTTEP